MMDIELTEEELQIILKRREEQERDKQAANLFLRRMKAAHEYSEWLMENGAGSTFSTFCDDFGYEAIENESLNLTYKIIMEVRDMVWSEGDW